MDEAVNSKREAHELFQPVLVCKSYLCPTGFFAGRFIQPRQMCDYQECQCEEHKCICLDSRFCQYEVIEVDSELEIKPSSCFPGNGCNESGWSLLFGFENSETNGEQLKFKAVVYGCAV